MGTDTLNGRNIVFPIYNEDGTPFHNLVLRKSVVDSIVMSLGDKITGDVYYNDNSLAFTMHEYVVYKDVKYTIVNPPTVVREGLVRDNSELKGMTKYSFEFYHPMYLLNNLPFADVAVSSDETRYLSENKTFSWIGKPDDFIAKLNKNLEGTEWVVVKSDRFPKDKASTLSQVLQFDKNTIGDAMKKAYEEWDIPYVIDSVSETEQYYGQGKRFKVVFGLPSNEIYETDVDRQAGIPFVFKMGQGVGLKNNSRTPRNNKIVTRLSGYGSERNIPYGYPQIVWTGDQSWTDTKNNPNDPTSYPLYKGIVGGRYVKLIKHPFTRTHLMPSVYRDSVNKKVNPFAQGYNPNIELVDYYDAKGDEYPNKINEASPSYEIHEFDTYPQMNDGSANISIVNAVPLDKDLNPVSDWDDSMDDEGNYIQSYFQITLPRLSFDIYACAAITEEMKVNMRSGACIGCTFDVQVDWEDYKNNFYDSNGDFAPDGTQRDTNKYPKSNEGSIVVVVKKDNTTFGTLMPNIYQNPKSGDEFVVLGISLPNEYIESAETKLDEEMKSYMLENNVYYYDYPLKFDEYFLATHTNILSQVKTNNIVHFDFSGNLLQLFVKQITIKYGNAPLPQYDITLSDNIEVVLNQIGKVADDVEHLGSLISMLRQTKQDDSYSLGLAQKLSKVDDDTARGLITFLKGLVSRGDVMVNGLLTAYNSIMNTIKSSNYTGDGVADSGWLLTNDYAGSSRLVVDYLYARKKAVFESLEIKELQFTSGDLAQSLASATIERTDYLQVDEQGEETILGYSDRKIPWTLKGFLMRLSSRKPYALARNKKIRINLKPEDLQNVNRVRCYFLAKDDNKKIFNLWKVNDLARCQTFNIDNIDRETYAGDTHKAGNVFWWRLVKGYSTEAVTVDGKDYHYFDVAYGFDAEQEANRTGIRTAWCDILSDLPAAGDKVVQFGNTETPARMNIIVSEVNGEGNADAPAIKSYRGVHTFNTDDCWWGGESCRKMMLSPSSGVEFYAPSFKFITEYGIERTQVERGAWLAIPFEEDTEHETFPDYSDDILDENGNFVSRSDGSPKKYVRKCRYYDRVEHKGSTWLCTIAESHYWRKYDNGVWSKITEAQYKALPQEEKDKCEEVRNYTTDEPSKASNDWTVSAERGQDGSFKSRVFCRTNINIKNANVRGGSYDNPIPTLTKIGDDVVEITWEDGVPQGTEMLWSTVCTFYGDGSNSGWSKPSQETDTETLDIEFSPNAIAPSAPVGTAANRNTQETIEARQAQGWYDPSRLPVNQQMIWRAECKIKNGVYETKDGNTAWVIARIKGEKGDKGTSVREVKPYYAKQSPESYNGNPPQDGWEESIAALGTIAEGWYVWTKNVISFTDNVESTTTYTVSKWGIDGDGIENIETKFYESANLLTQTQLENLDESDWKEYSQLALKKGDYIYTRTKITYDKGDTPTISYMVNRLGQDGVGYVGTEEYYVLGNSQTNVPSGHPYTGNQPYKKYTAAEWQQIQITGGWSESRPTYQGDDKKYLWNFEVSFDTDGNVMVTRPICIGNYAKGIVSIVESYAISAYAVAPQTGSYPSDITTWTDEAHDCAPTDAKPYQWNKTVTTYSDGTSDTFYHVSAVKGTNGTSIEHISVYKAQSDKPDAPTGTKVPPSGWSIVPVSDKESASLTFTYTGDWTQSGNVLTSNAIGNDKITKEKVSFSITEPVTVKVKLTASSEANYDYVLIGNPDEDNVTRTGNYKARVSGTESIEVELEFGSVGEHFFVVAYAKDVSGASGSDNGKFEILGAYKSNAIPIWVSTSKLVNDVCDGNWSEPVRWNGKDGETGKNGKDAAIAVFSRNPIVFQGSSLGSSVNTNSISSVIRVLDGGTEYTPTNINVDSKPSGVTVTASSGQVSVSPLQTGLSEDMLTGSIKLTLTYNGGKTVVGYLTTTVARAGEDASYDFITLHGTCHDGSSSAKGFITVQKDGTKTSMDTLGRGLTFFAVNRETLQIVISGTLSPSLYDTYGDITKCDSLAAKIRSCNNSYFVCLVSHDAIGWNENLVSAIREYGGMTPEKTDTSRYPFVFIGVKGLSQGYALQQQGEYQSTLGAQVTAYVNDSMFSSVKQGHMGRTFYYDGVYDSSKEYKVTQYEAPFVSYNSNYWVRIGDDGMTATGQAPSTTSPYWALMTSTFKYLITEAIFSGYARLGSWVFNGDYMYSEKGKAGTSEVSYNSTTYYYHGDSDKTYTPYIVMNAQGGYAHFGAGSSKFNPDGSGQLAGGNINWNADGSTLNVRGTISTMNGGCKIWYKPTAFHTSAVAWDGLSVIDTTTENEIASIGEDIYVKSDSADYAPRAGHIVLQYQGDDGTINNTIELDSRKNNISVKSGSSILASINGGAFSSDTVTAYSQVSSAAFYGRHSSGAVSLPSNVLSGNTVTLPSNPTNGMFIFCLKCTTISANKTIYDAAGDSQGTSWNTNNSKPRIFVYYNDGWREFYCAN